MREGKRTSSSSNGSAVGRAMLGLAAGLLGLALVLPAVALLLPFWLVGTLTRILKRFLASTPLPWHELIEFYPQVGWRPRPNAAAHALDHGGDSYQFTTDAHGWRGSRTLEESDVVVFGDSHAFGCGVDDRHFFADLTESARVKAIGAPAYSMVQPVLWMERLVSHLKEKTVIWLVCLGNDLDDSMHPGLHQYRAPFVRQNPDRREWEIVTDHVDPKRWTITSREGSLASMVEICSPGHTSSRVFSAVDHLVGQARDVCASAEAQLVLMTIPELSPVARRYFARIKPGPRFDETLPDQKFGEICDRHGVRFVALRDHLTSEDYLYNDFHWNPRGHRRVARLIDKVHLDASRSGTSRLRTDRRGLATEAAG